MQAETKVPKRHETCQMEQCNSIVLRHDVLLIDNSARDGGINALHGGINALPDGNMPLPNA